MIPFVHIFEDIFDNVAAEILASTGIDIYYEYGHPLEIVNTLAEKTGHNSFKYKKYPLIMLFQDFNEDHDVAFDYSIRNITVIIATSTKPTYKAKDRYNNTFVPLLYPIYTSLIKNLRTSVNIDWEEKNHIKIDRLYWGKDGLYGNTGNVFNDYLDAIQIEIKEININNKC